jgi:hypothetical protein
MPQIFSRTDTLVIKLALIALAVGGFAAFAVIRWRMSAAVDEGSMPAQPIAFSHKHHVGDDGLDCRYCHTSVEKSSFAGMPSTRICLTCHSQLFRDSPALAALHESARTGTPIAWTRVYDLPDFVYFDHGIHVSKGVGCVECHGTVDRMPLMRRAAPLTMQWCLACHRDPAPHLRAPEHVFSTVSTRALGAHEGADLTRFYGLQSRRRLTDCSTCHR